MNLLGLIIIFPVPPEFTEITSELIMGERDISNMIRNITLDIVHLYVATYKIQRKIINKFNGIKNYPE